MYAISTIVFAHYKHRPWKIIKVSRYHSAQFIQCRNFFVLLCHTLSMLMSTGDKTGFLHPQKRRKMLQLSRFTLFHQRFGLTKQAREAERKYVREERGNFTSDEKCQLEELVQCYKAEYDILVVNSAGRRSLIDGEENMCLICPKRLCFSCSTIILH